MEKPKDNNVSIIEHDRDDFELEETTVEDLEEDGTIKRTSRGLVFE